MASGNLLCDNYKLIDDWKKRGLVEGDTLDLTSRPTTPASAR